MRGARAGAARVRLARRDGRAGLARNAAYLVRPDGYIGCAAGGADAATLGTYIDTWITGMRAKER